MCFGEIRISLDGSNGGLLGPQPGGGRRGFDIPVKQRIAVGQLRMGDSKLRIEMDRALESFDCLPQTFR